MPELLLYGKEQLGNYVIHICFCVPWKKRHEGK